jgi:hypothetical protein
LASAGIARADIEDRTCATVVINPRAACTKSIRVGDGRLRPSAGRSATSKVRFNRTGKWTTALEDAIKRPRITGTIWSRHREVNLLGGGEADQTCYGLTRNLLAATWFLEQIPVC